MLAGPVGLSSGLRQLSGLYHKGASRSLQHAGSLATQRPLASNRIKPWAHKKLSFVSRAVPSSDKTQGEHLSSDDNKMQQVLPKIAVSVLLLAAAGIAFYLFGAKQLSLRDVAAQLDELIRSYGPWGPVIFVAAYVAATIVLIPSTALTLAAGYLFGPGYGTALVSLAATIGAALAFLISRYLAQPYAKARLQKYPKLESIEKQISAEGVKLVLLLRLAPLVPFTVLNYALGVTDIAFLPYISATWIGKLPGVFSSVYLGSTGRSIDAATTAGGIDKVSLALNVVGVVASVLVTKLLADKASAVLNDEVNIDS